MIRQFKSSLGLLVGLIALAGCSGSPTGTNSGDVLADVEIQALLDELSETLGGVGGVPAASIQGVEGGVAFSQRAEPVSASFNESVPCTSGTVAIAGSVNGDLDPQTFLGSLDVEFSWDFNSCAVITETTTVTVEGDPHIEFAGSFVFGENSFSVSGTQVGGFSFTTADGRAGSCAIDVQFSSSVNATTNAVSGSLSGTVCGKSANAFEVLGASS